VGRSVATALVVLLHVAIVYALVTGLAYRVVKVISTPLETKIIEEVKPVTQDIPPPTRMPMPKFEVPPAPYIPPPEVRIQQPAPPKSPIALSTPVKPEAPTPPPVVRAVEAPPSSQVRIPPVIDPVKHCEKPEYPPAARRLGETGTVVLRILIDADGSVIASEVDTSSGYKRLDEAARRGLSLCRFKPGTVDGKPEQAWATLRYAWKLQD